MTKTVAQPQAVIRAFPHVTGVSTRVKAEPTKLSPLACKIMSASGTFSTPTATGAFSTRREAGSLPLGRSVPLGRISGAKREESADVALGRRAPLTIPIANIRPGRFQPRRRFAAKEIAGLAQLAQSIREKGILQPVLVRPMACEPGKYELVAGERRWRAAQQAQLHEIPVLVREFGDRDTLEVALVENLQRQDLTPIEEARGYQRMIDEFHRTQEDVAEIVGKSRPHIANMLRLLTLTTRVQDMIDDRRLSAGHARSLVGLAEAEAEELAERIVSGSLSVRETERMVQRVRADGSLDTKRGIQDELEDGRAADLIELKTVKGGEPEDSRVDDVIALGRPKRVVRGEPEAGRSAGVIAIERDLAERLGLGVQIKAKAESGEVTIRYKTLAQLDDLLANLRRAEGDRKDRALIASAMPACQFCSGLLRPVLAESVNQRRRQDDGEAGLPGFSRYDIWRAISDGGISGA